MTTTLTPIQTQALARLLAGQTVAAVARELKIDRSTIYDWRSSKPQFRDALEEGRTLLNELTADALADLAATAVDTLRHLLTSPLTPPSVRLRAAESVLRALHQQQQRQQQRQPRHQDEHPSAPGMHPEGPAPAPAASPAATADTPRPAAVKAGRNQPCPCGSLKKYKRCCGNPLAPSGGLTPAAAIPHNPTLSNTAVDAAEDRPPLDRAA